ncbi:hypothetical protein F2Q69_00029340 [Brassica cretica]|uniref:Uncharacterized protein n=1 Tax=Brassica cretica TaxID=69181 RepID=A0A8S9SA13_BRACR|nr:hypothetical protein F2Q69_00029340 [Brassica cretica]
MNKQKKLKACEVRHVPVVAGETRPFSDVSAPGGGNVCGSAFRAIVLEVTRRIRQVISYHRHRTTNQRAQLLAL